MVNNRKYKLVKIIVMFAIFIFTPAILEAQHRGDNLSFQGLAYQDNLSTFSSSMGGAMIAVPGDISSLFYNTAGLAKINKFQISISGSQYNRQWRENQNYWSNRVMLELPMYLEGLYIPLPENNGKMNYDIFKDSGSNYYLISPQLGKDPYDESAADWKNSKKLSGIKNASIAAPFNFLDAKFVVAASYLRNSINDFDRNDTYLNPFFSSYDYEQNIVREVTGLGKDTLLVHWSRFTRQRTGFMNNIHTGIAAELLENIMFGAGVNIMTGNSDDFQSLVRVGDFLLRDAQQFYFSYIDSAAVTNGSSKYSSIKGSLSTMITLNAVKLGLKIDLPYTLKRDWNYTQQVKGADTSIQYASGRDQVVMPLVYSLGISFQPVETFLVSFSYELAPYSKAKFSIASMDSSYRKWTDQNTLAFGLKYDMSNLISLMAGYRTIPEVFVPDGAAIRDKGPGSNSYNFGLTLNTDYGRVDFAYEYRVLKYYDSYYSNTNYAFESNSTLMMGITYSF